MKNTKLFLFSLIISMFISSTNAQLEVDQNGNVGIKTTPSGLYALKVYGKIYSTSTIQSSWLNSEFCNFDMLTINGDDYTSAIEVVGDADYEPVVDISGESWMDYALRVDHGIYGTVYGGSDIKLKKDILALDGIDVLSKLKLIEGKIYKLKSDEELADKLSKKMPDKDFSDVSNRRYYGLIAQDVEQYFPDLVKTDSAGYKAINYSGMIPLLLEAIKKQQIQIEALQANSSQLKSLSLSTEENVNIQKAVLYQNRPNPYSINTAISYNIPDNVESAMICIYDLNGTQLKCYHIDQTGLGELIVYGNELKPGMFTYSLIVDGTLVDSKKMILTD